MTIQMPAAFTDAGAAASKARHQKHQNRGILTVMGSGRLWIPPGFPKNVGRASPTRTASVARSIRRAIRRGWPSGALDIVNDPKKSAT